MTSPAAASRELGGVWMHGTQIAAPADACAQVEQVNRARLNVVLLLMWYWREGRSKSVVAV